MALPQQFLSYHNFELAFTRLIRAGNKEYKQFYRHLFPSYSLALKENLSDLVKDIRSGAYGPGKPTVIFQPKKNGVLRPLALLPFCDLIVYQALVNVIAAIFEKIQEKYAFKRAFGHIYAGKSSPFFYRSWKICYVAYSTAITNAFNSGNNWVADFDLVSFYELIDHKLLRSCLEKAIKSHELLDLLFRCLEAWTTDSGGAHLGHGVPQGPEPSAFLAECFLFHFDAKTFKGDITEFKFSLLRMNLRRDVLKRIVALLVKRPDCSWVFAAYLKKFPNHPEAANILLEALRQDPTYDAAAANYILLGEKRWVLTGGTSNADVSVCSSYKLEIRVPGFSC